MWVYHDLFINSTALYFQLYRDMIKIQVSLKCAIWWFNIPIYYKMLTVIRLVNTSFISLIFHFLFLWWWEYQSSTFIATFQYRIPCQYIVIMLYPKSREFIHLINESTLSPTSAHFLLCFHEFDVFRFHMKVRSYSCSSIVHGSRFALIHCLGWL